jgi:hypothetical protein
MLSSILAGLLAFAAYLVVSGAVITLFEWLTR